MIKQEFLEISLNKDLMVDVHYKNGCVAHNQMYCSGWYRKEFELNEVICIPRCRPLSDLIRPIEHMGEKFVPISELAKMEGLIPSERIAITTDGDIRLRLLLDPENKRSLTPVDFILDITECVFKIQSTTWHSMQVKTQREMQKKLLQWHFDIGGLIEKDEAIDVNTLEINPYK